MKTAFGWYKIDIKPVYVGFSRYESGWTVVELLNSNRVSDTQRFASFQEALDFANAIASQNRFGPRIEN